ncbi:MAG: DUF1992 domain-containing protein [Planctomycetes bacterium]|nr:DUF1992 domain-containing protein [Planctomycetota bacterium]
MDPFDAIAETRIREAIARGELRDLPGAGRPLELEDLSRVPAELRAAYILLKSQGFAPAELELRRDVLRLRDLLAACNDGSRAADLRGRLRNLELRYEVLTGRRADTPVWAEYAEQGAGYPATGAAETQCASECGAGARERPPSV